jgi:hypothetical protein
MHSTNAMKLALYISSLPNLSRQPEERNGYGHMGATLTDAILQPGLNYRTVVYPRVRNVMRRFPDATSTAAFWSIIGTFTAAEVLNWSHPEKPRRLYELTRLLLENGVQTEADLRRWITTPLNADRLLRTKGIGPKTVDYIGLLVGVPTVAIDRHIRKFIAMAGVQVDDYDELKLLVLESAEILELDPGTLDHSIWHYLSGEGES